MKTALSALFRRYKLWWDTIIIHHSWSVDHDTLDWQGIRRYHTSYRIDSVIVSKEVYLDRKARGEGKLFQLPWTDIGYHFGIEMINDHYEILIGRPMTEPGAHCKGMNNRSLGICFIGNYDIAPPPDEMLEYAARRLIRPLLAISGYGVDCIKGHREYAEKSCPGKRFNLDKLFGCNFAQH